MTGTQTETEDPTCAICGTASRTAAAATASRGERVARRTEAHTSAGSGAIARTSTSRITSTTWSQRRDPASSASATAACTAKNVGGCCDIGFRSAFSVPSPTIAGDRAALRHRRQPDGDVLGQQPLEEVQVTGRRPRLSRQQVEDRVDVRGLLGPCRGGLTAAHVARRQDERRADPGDRQELGVRGSPHSAEAPHGRAPMSVTDGSVAELLGTHARQQDRTDAQQEREDPRGDDRRHRDRGGRRERREPGRGDPRAGDLGERRVGHHGTVQGQRGGEAADDRGEPARPAGVPRARRHAIALSATNAV